jgi:hypothetical protein
MKHKPGLDDGVSWVMALEALFLGLNNGKACDKWGVSGVSSRTCKVRIGDYRRKGELLSNISGAGPDMC